ncbi:MAG: 4Fe-4S dicluster domain-containing protein [Eggerthellaceae bacterium]|nr:4Fe-4S dicluster domain-containing protein [Eggerthellaceae bacterium]MDR2715923.1 4Fe-4S dicluster domain-containing protein [Coriobacteriaceae bacterium]
MHRRFVVIDEDLCVGCAFCVDLCPLRNVLDMNDKGDKAFVKNPYYCAGCFKCIERCPSRAIRSASLTGLDDSA